MYDNFENVILSAAELSLRNPALAGNPVFNGFLPCQSRF